MKSYSSSDLSSPSLYRQSIDHPESRSIINQQLAPHLTLRLIYTIDTTDIELLPHIITTILIVIIIIIIIIITIILIIIIQVLELTLQVE